MASLGEEEEEEGPKAMLVCTVSMFCWIGFLRRQGGGEVEVRWRDIGSVVEGEARREAVVESWVAGVIEA